MRITQLFAAGMVLLPVSASAQDAFIPGVYLASPELCERARAEGLQTVIEQSEIILTARGLDAIEHNCRFLDVKPRDGGGAWLADALCENPGEAYPDMFSIMDRGEGRLELTSLSDMLRAQLGIATDPAATGEETANGGTVTPGDADGGLTLEGSATVMEGGEQDASGGEAVPPGGPRMYHFCEGVPVP